MKLIMLTSSGYRGDASYFSSLGVSAYFDKPAKISDIKSALSIVIEDSEAMQHASPLVTTHYVQTLSKNKGKERVKLTSNEWPENTRLLLVEDVQVNQLVAKGLLSNLGLQIDIAANGIEAIKSLKMAPDDAPYTLVLMDCQMPEMDGYEASRQIRAAAAGERYIDLDIIAMTANAMKGDREKCLKAGMSDYLSKPIQAEKLHDMLYKWLFKDSTHGALNS